MSELNNQKLEALDAKMGALTELVGKLLSKVEKLEAQPTVEDAVAPYFAAVTGELNNIQSAIDTLAATSSSSSGGGLT